LVRGHITGRREGQGHDGKLDPLVRGHITGRPGGQGPDRRRKLDQLVRGAHHGAGEVAMGMTGGGELASWSEDTTGRPGGQGHDGRWQLDQLVRRQELGIIERPCRGRAFRECIAGAGSWPSRASGRSEHYGSQCAGVTGARVFATTWPKAVAREVQKAAE
jgi:hypothetical protein